MTALGRIENAKYTKQPIPGYAGNPLIEALPQIVSEEEAIDQLTFHPAYDATARREPPHIRYHLIEMSQHFFEPLPRHIELEQQFSRLLRGGYVARNPLQHGYWSQMSSRSQKVGISEPTSFQKLSAGALPLIGISGGGKTTAADRICGLYPQVIHHSEFGGRRLTLSQIVYLKVNCPFNGSTKGLCNNFFQEVDRLLGTNYHNSYAGSRTTVDEMLPRMAQVASLHCLGTLIIDELQHVNQAASGGAKKMLNFFVQLVNTIGLPVILIGTYQVMNVLVEEFRQIRRLCGQGNPYWEPMKNDETWDLFLPALWRYQYTAEPTLLTKELSDTLYHECMGIMDLAI